MKKKTNSLHEKAISTLSCFSRFFLLLLFVVVNCTTALAENDQQQKVSGIVRDQTGEPLPGVNIVVVGTNTGTITDIDGAFSLNVIKLY